MQLPILITARLADYIVSRRIEPASVFHGVTGNSLRSLEKAGQAGIVTVIEHPMVHPRRWQSEVLEECRRFGVNPRDCDTVLPEPLIRRREQEFARADKIIVLSRFARSTFEAEGLQKAETILPGIDENLFRPAEALRPADPFRICYMGRLEMGKGVLYLLKAWKQLKLKDAELLLMGEVRPEVARAVGGYMSSNVRMPGFVQSTAMAQALRRCSVFAFPSLHEGFGLVLLEAMASGVPVIATRTSGAPDCVTEGEEGFIVQPRSSEEIAEKIEWCYRNREALVWMGQKARRKVETNFTLQCYRARLVEFYERLVSR
jgi:glycosyltransferase involved in cell wall biosynthesis